MLSINSSSATVNRVQPNKAAVSGAGNKPKTGPVAPVGQPLPAGAVLSRFNVTTPDGKTVMLEEALRTSSKYVSKTTQGDLVFIAPATGSTTPNSDSTRSELRETDATGKLKNWNPYVGTHVLEGQATVRTVTSGGRVTLAQIHAVNNKNPPIKLMYRIDGKGSPLLYAEYRATKNPIPVTVNLLEKLPLGQKFSYRISVRNGNAEVVAESGGKRNVLKFVVDGTWRANPFYFKAGAYNTGTDATGTGASTVVHSGIRAYHV
ncbi:MAG TPA: polysaccharide lyase family 7 protein [Rhizobiaceae bacterium]|nr:polysaccharide lyase family 7 protein [Rhizobiaceae bacterium]